MQLLSSLSARHRQTDVMHHVCHRVICHAVCHSLIATIFIIHSVHDKRVQLHVQSSTARLRHQTTLFTLAKQQAINKSGCLQVSPGIRPRSPHSPRDSGQSGQAWSQPTCIFSRVPPPLRPELRATPQRRGRAQSSLSLVISSCGDF